MLEKEITFDRFVRILGIVLLVGGVLYTMNFLSSVLLPFFVAWLLAYLMYPIVKFVQYKLHVPTRALSIIVALVFVLAVIGGVFYLIIPPMIDQFEKLGDIVMQYVKQGTNGESFQAVVQQWLHDNRQAIEQVFKRKDVSDAIKSAMPKLFSVLGQTANVILSIVASLITLLYMFFILLDYEYLSSSWIKIFPKKVRPFWQSLMTVARGADNGNTLLHRFHDNRLPDGYRSGNTDRHYGPRAISAYLCPDSNGIPRIAQGCRHRTELLGDTGECRGGVLHRAGDNRHGGDAEGDGKGDGTESRHPAPRPLCVGHAARIHRTYHSPAADNDIDSLLSAICHKRKGGRTCRCRIHRSRGWRSHCCCNPQR